MKVIEAKLFIEVEDDAIIVDVFKDIGQRCNRGDGYFITEFIELKRGPFAVSANGGFGILQEASKPGEQA